MTTPSGHSVGFIHLRVHSAYSLSEGALPVKQIAALAKERDMPAVAITDTGNLFGALEFSGELAAKGIQPIIGSALRVDMDESAEAQPKLAAAQTGLKRLPTLVLLAKDHDGYRNLMKLSSRAYLDAPDHAEPHVLLSLLRQAGAGLICLTGGPSGPINRALVLGQFAQARERLIALRDIFGDRLYVELQRHGMEEERAAETGLLELAYELGLPLAATNECYFATPDDYAAHDALLCIAEGEVVANDDRRRVTPEHYFKSQNEMLTLFADLPEAAANTVEIARRCAFYLGEVKPLLPHFGDADEAEQLRAEALAGLEARLAVTGLAEGYSKQDYLDRLEFELGVIIKMNYAGYFLIVADFIKWAKGQTIPVGPGRGSGAGSLVAYCLTITDLDPLRFKLLFERFLNPARVSMPDFDVDFCQDRRDEVIAYVQSRYGADRVAQIITFGKLQARAVCRDVGRVLQMPYPQVDRISKMIPMNPANPVSLKEAIAAEPRIGEERDRDPTVARMLEIGQKLEGLYRHASTHAAGVVIGDRPLEELVPLYRDPRASLPATQFNMKYVEKAGLVKFDFLGLKTLTVIDKAERLIHAREPGFRTSLVPLDDAKTFAMLAQGDTVGVFQLESAGMRDAVRQMHADRFEDLIALVALYRPGPMANIPTYCHRKLGKEPVEYLHPLLEPILKETFGVITYQEQVQQVAKDMAGFSLGHADILRRAMGKKNPREMAEQRERFMNGATERGIAPETATLVFDACAKFAEYGFNKSHSAPYAYISYQTAWLKANHPVEFLAASMTLDMGNTDKLQVFRDEALRLGIKVRPPSINHGGVDFAVQDGAILYALAALKNVGQGAIRHIETVRASGGRFASLSDFARRIDPTQLNKRALESLIKAGAFDELNPNRAQLLAGIETILATASRTTAEAEAGQHDLFGSGGVAPADMVLPNREAWLPMEKLAQEFEAVGFYLSGHPLDDYMKPLARMGVESWAQFRTKVLTKGATAAKLAGTITMRQERRSKSGNKYAFVGFSDPTGQFEAICFSETLTNARDLLEPGKAVLAHVEADVDGEDIKLRLQAVEKLDRTAAAIAQGVQIFLRDAAPLESIAQRLEARGRAPVKITLIEAEGREIDVALGARFIMTPQIKGAIRAIPGVVEVLDL